MRIAKPPAHRRRQDTILTETLPLYPPARGSQGIGSWCDDETATDICHFAEKLSASNRGLTVPRALQALLPMCGDKRALTYLDGKGNEVRAQCVLLTCIYIEGWLRPPRPPPQSAPRQPPP